MARNSDTTIIRVASDYPSGKPTFGLQPVFYYLSREQARLGYNVHVIAKRRNPEPALQNREGVEISRVESPFGLNALREIRKLEGIRSVIHTHATSGIFLVPVKSTLKSPLVSQVHGCSRSKYMPQRVGWGNMVQDYSASKMWYYYFRERMLWSSADRVLAVSGTTKSDLEAYYKIPSQRVNVVYNGVDIDIFKPVREPKLPPQLDRLRDKKIVLYVGHFGPRKGIIFLIKAIRKIVGEVKDAVLVCIGGVPGWLGGSDYWSFLRATIRENELEGKVFLLDKVPNEELPNYYSLANVFVLPSFYEAFAKVVIEAMACAKPVVITREGGPKEAIEEGRSGLLITYGDVDGIAVAVTRLLRDEKSARLMGSEARKRIEKDFTWTAVAERMGRAYEQALRKRS